MLKEMKEDIECMRKEKDIKKDQADRKNRINH